MPLSRTVDGYHLISLDCDSGVYRTIEAQLVDDRQYFRIFNCSPMSKCAGDVDQVFFSHACAGLSVPHQAMPRDLITLCCHPMG